MKIVKTIALTAIVTLCFGTFALAADTQTPAMTTDPTMPAHKARLIDINTATSAQLAAIPEVGDEYAKKIIVGRPYGNIEKLKTNNIIPADLYGKINKLIKALC